LGGAPQGVYDPGVVTSSLLFIGGLSTWEMLVVVMVGLLLFGSKLPDVGRQLGRSLMEFKKGLKGFTEDMQATERETERLISEAEENERRRREARDAARQDPPPSSGGDIPHDPPPTEAPKRSVADLGRDPAGDDARS
jgi:sec-independent protein translocase protein TatA